MHDILAYAGNHETFTPSLQYAASLANQLDARVDMLYVQEPITILPSSAAMGLVAEIAKFTSEQIETAKRNQAKFRRWAADRGASNSDWMVIEGMLRLVLAETCNWHDLLVLGIGGETKWGSVARLGEVLLTCGVPCILVPEGPSASPPTANLSSIAIAWSGSPESVRAIHAALPLLKRAGHVTVIDGEFVDPQIHLTRFSPMEIGSYLARHGIKFTKRRLEISDERAGEALLATARDFKADLLVMGAYGKSRFSEWFFGGATRHVLEHANMPLFMRH
jgi:nucleotide-binding universal stress UspA family protein